MTNFNQLVKLFLIIMLVVSCTRVKLRESDPVSPTITSPLSGKEFIFDSLIWQKYSGIENEVYFITPSLSSLLQNVELFKSGYLQSSEVQIKIDTASVWKSVKPDHDYDNTLPIQYLYTINTSRLIVNVWPADFRLVGSKTSIKIKFK